MKNSTLNKVSKSLLLHGLLACSTLSSMQVLAQQEPPEEDENTLEVIMVTANRTASSAEKTPIALSVLGPNQLREQGITNPTQLADQVPNVSIDRNNGLQITIRGVTSSDNTEKGDPSAAFMLDGIYIARPQAQEVSFFDIDRVEVLRGPQGTLYGRNTTAGLVNVIAAKPQDYFEASIDAVIGNYNTKNITGVLNFPVSDNFAIRAAVNVHQRDNYLKLDYTGAGEKPDITNFKDNASFRLSALWQPTDDSELLVRYDHATIKGNNFGSAPIENFFTLEDNVTSLDDNGDIVNHGPGYSVDVNPRYNNSDDKDVLTIGALPDIITDNDTWGVMADYSLNINEQFTFNYLGSYREFTRDEPSDGILLAPGFFFPSQMEGDFEQFSHELRLAYDDGDLQAQAGLYMFEEESEIFFKLIGLVNPTPGQDGYVFGFPQDPTKSTSLGVFGQATYALTDDLKITAGIRSTEDEKSRRGATVFHKNLGEELDFTFDPVNNFIPDSLNYAKRSYSQTTWKLGVDYDLDDATLLYGSISTGYKAGGFNDGCVSGAEGCTRPLPEEAVYYDPETLTSVEIGAKTRLLDNKMKLNAALFTYDYKDLQLSQVSEICGAPCQVTTNAAAATINGLEVDFLYRPSSKHRVTGAITWLDAKYDDWQLSPEVNFKGQPLARSPELAVIAGYQYSIELNSGAGIDLGINTRWSDEYVITNTGLRANFVQPSFMKTDLSVTYNSADGLWYVQAFAKNIENEITLSNAGTSSAITTANGDVGFRTGTATFADPRLIGIRFGYKFD